MEDLGEEGRKGKKKGKNSRLKSHSSVLQEAAASSSTGNDREDEEEKDFIETHCHWVNCDREFGTQDQLVKVNIILL